VERKNIYRLLVGKPEGKRPLRRRRWIINLKMDLLVIVVSGVEWIVLLQVE
jgi:hypothetical protein